LGSAALCTSISSRHTAAKSSGVGRTAMPTSSRG
jgi:hypothetical protein